MTTSCDAELQMSPCTIVIFGASGDLTARKLIPALFRMYRKGFLPELVTIIGCARTQFDDVEFRSHLQGAVFGSDEGSEEWQEFSAKLYYQRIDYGELESYGALEKRIYSLDRECETDGNILFDLAVPPSLYGVIAQMLGRVGLATPDNDGGWVRMVVEKPFGRDFDSALKLEEILHQHFKEEQIFRIDHYLAKETVQNILSFRFANQIFEPLWNRNHVAWVGIISAENLGVEARAGYYDTSGVLRDMFQNHMMQLLSLIAMEPPSRFHADSIRDEKIKIFNSILPFSGNDEDIILGQYSAGLVDGKTLEGYLEEEGVAHGSRTPTFAMLKLDIDNWRWQGVPFYLVSGKRMRRKETRLVIQFKEAPLSMFKGVAGEHASDNRLVLSIFPEESIQLSIQAKIPGSRLCLRTGNLDFSYTDDNADSNLDAYEKVILDCILGDHMLFWRKDGIAAAWKLLTPILEDCEGEDCRYQRLHSYTAGSWGPAAANKIVEEIIR
jgi:glucose-6-phosphate 1-dehydrogenase